MGGLVGVDAGVLDDDASRTMRRRGRGRRVTLHSSRAKAPRSRNRFTYPPPATSAFRTPGSAARSGASTSAISRGLRRSALGEVERSGEGQVTQVGLGRVLERHGRKSHAEGGFGPRPGSSRRVARSSSRIMEPNTPIIASTPIPVIVGSPHEPASSARSFGMKPSLHSDVRRRHGRSPLTSRGLARSKGPAATAKRPRPTPRPSASIPTTRMPRSRLGLVLRELGRDDEANLAFLSALRLRAGRRFDGH